MRYRKITLLFMVLTFCVLFFCNDVHAASITSPTGSVRGTATFAVYASHAYMADFTVTDSAGNIKIGSAKIYGSNSLSSRPIDITAWKNGSYSIVCTVYCSYRDSDGEYHSWQENASGQFSIDKEFGAVIVSPEGSVKGQCTLGVQAVVDGAVPTKVDIVVKDSTGIKKIDYYINQHINGLFRYGPIDITSWKNGTYTFEAVMHFTSGEKTELITGEFSIDKVFDAVIVSPEGSVRGQCSLGVQAVVDGAVPTKVDIVVKDSTGIKKIDYYINQHINGLFRYGPIDITSWKNGTYTFEAVMHFTSGEKTEPITRKFTVDKVFGISVIFPSEDEKVGGLQELKAFVNLDGAVFSTIQFIIKDSSGAKIAELTPRPGYAGYYVTVVDFSNYSDGEYSITALLKITSGESDDDTHNFKVEKIYRARILRPSAGAKVHGTITVRSQITIEKARMRYLQLHIRKKGQPSTDKLLSEWRSETNNREYNYNLNTTAYENGDYELYLVLTNTTERDPPFISPPTEIKIDNRLDIEISQPSDGASILLPSTGIIVVKAVKAYGDYSITKMLFYIRPENGVYPINPSAQDITPDGAGIYEGQIPVSVPGTYFVKAVAEYRTSSLSSQVEHEHKFTVFEQGALAISCNPGWVRPAAFVVGYRKRLIDEAKTKVTVTGAKPGAQITLEIEGIYDTGGHLAELIVKNADGTVTVRKHETPRPTGTFESGINKISGVTDDNGTFSCIYTASSIAGQERIIAKCDGKRAEYVLDVKIPDLVKMPKPEGKRYELVGCPSGAHSETHYLLPGFIPVLDIIAQKYYGKFEDDRMKFNDMSLPWGGKFDYKYNNWTGPHDTHMSGRCCDLNDVGRGQGVPPFNDNARNEFLEDLIRNELKLYLLKEPTCWHIQWNYKVDGSRGGY